MLAPITNLTLTREADGTYSAVWTETGAEEYQIGVNGSVVQTVTGTTVTGLTLKPGDVVSILAEAFSPSDSVTVPAVPALKPQIVGMLDRTTVSPAWPWLRGVVINARWDQLQATAGGPLIGKNPVDVGLAAIASFRAANPGVKRSARLRLYLGSRSPEGDASSWVQELGGAPITVTGAQGQSGTVGRYWTPAYQEAYADLQSKLAAAYDGDQELAEVTPAEPSLLYAETCLRYSVPALQAAGSTVLLERAAYAAGLAAMSPWVYTRPYYAFNPCDYPGIGGVTQTLALMAAFRTLWPGGIQGNNSWRNSDLGADYDAMFAAMTGPQGVQTATLSRLVSLVATVQKALGAGKSSLELPAGYVASGSATLQALDAEFV